MAYSHRDRRAHRDVRRDFGLVVGAGLTLAVLTMVVPWTALAVGALAGMAALGAGYLLRADRLLEEYARDLQRVRAGTERSGFLRAEVESEVGLERQIVRPSATSPHRRRGPIAPGREETDPVPGKGP